MIGVAGTAGDTNNWPANESPDHAIDGVGQKYLNFGREDSRFIVTPSSGSSVVTSLKFWTANDAEPRDPASYELWGTNANSMQIAEVQANIPEPASVVLALVLAGLAVIRCRRR